MTNIHKSGIFFQWNPFNQHHCNNINFNSKMAEGKGVKPEFSIRLLEKKDEKAASALIWKLIYYNTAMDIIAENIMRKRCIMLYMICAIYGYLDQYLWAQALLYFLNVPCMIYIISRFVVLPFDSHFSQGNAKGLYNFWSRNDIGRRMWVAEVDGVVVGTVAVERLSATTAEVFRVCMKKRYRGMGIAQSLIQTLLNHCQSRGYDHVTLLVSHVQVPAQRLYEKTGFKKVNCQQVTVFPYFLFYHKYLYHYSLKGSPPGFWTSSEGQKRIYS